jgi:hypothetical protein
MSSFELAKKVYLDNTEQKNTQMSDHGVPRSHTVPHVAPLKYRSAMYRVPHFMRMRLRIMNCQS